MEHQLFEWSSYLIAAIFVCCIRYTEKPTLVITTKEPVVSKVFVTAPTPPTSTLPSDPADLDTLKQKDLILLARKTKLPRYTSILRSKKINGLRTALRKHLFELADR